MIRVHRAMGVGALGAVPTVQPCLTTAPYGFRLQQSYFNAGGRYAQGSPGHQQFGAWALGVDAHLRQACYGNDIGSSQYQSMYYSALMLLANEKWEKEQLEADCDQDLQETEDALSAAEDAFDACQAALAAGQNCPPVVSCPAPTVCPPPISCPPPTVCPPPQQRPQAPQQQKKAGFGANLGWLAGGAVAGAGLFYFMRKR